MERWSAGSLTAAQFARKAGVSEGSLRWWKWRLDSERRESASRPRAAQKADSGSVSPLSFVEMTSVVPLEPVEVVLAGGTRIRVPADFDASMLERLLDVLERRR